MENQNLSEEKTSLTESEEAESFLRPYTEKSDSNKTPTKYFILAGLVFALLIGLVAMGPRLFISTVSETVEDTPSAEDIILKVTEVILSPTPTQLTTSQVTKLPFGAPLGNLSRGEKIPSFILWPYGVAIPRVYKDGKWKALPESFSSTISEKSELLVYCGPKGLFVYDIRKDVNTNVVKKDFLECYDISYSDETKNITTYTNSEVVGMVVKNIYDTKSGQVIATDSAITFNEMLNMKDKDDYIGLLYTDNERKCDSEKCISRRLQTMELSYLDGQKMSIEIPDLYGIEAVNGNIVWYSAYSEEGPTGNRELGLAPVGRYLNLNAYFINEKKKVELLDKFNSGQLVYFIEN